jgi:pyrroloquinoline-quinone synthase
MNDVVNALDARIAAKHLLDHPFYQRWTAGTLSSEELREYARQYYHYALAFPTFLSAMHSHTGDVATRQALLENLIDEERGPENHPELWLRFCEALGLSRAEVESGRPSEATRALIDAVKRSCRDGALSEGLAALYAYESQVPAVSKAKIAGLAQWYGIVAPRDVAFFSVHIDADVAHSTTSRELLSRLCADGGSRAAAETSASRTLDALYGFLDSVTAAS